MVVVEDKVDRWANSCCSTFVTVVSLYHHQWSVQEPYPCFPPLYISMLFLGCIKPFTLRLFAAGVSSSLSPRCSPLSSRKPSSRKNPIATKTSPLPSLRLSNTLDLKSLMKDLESELFHYTAGRFLWVSCILCQIFKTPNVTYSVRMRIVASESVAASSIFPVCSKSLPRHRTARLQSFA